MTTIAEVLKAKGQAGNLTMARMYAVAIDTVWAKQAKQAKKQKPRKAYRGMKEGDFGSRF